MYTSIIKKMEGTLDRQMAAVAATTLHLDGLRSLQAKLTNAGQTDIEDLPKPAKK